MLLIFSLIFYYNNPKYVPYSLFETPNTKDASLFSNKKGGNNLKYFKWGIVGAAIYGAMKVMQNGMLSKLVSSNDSKDAAAVTAMDSVFTGSK